MLKKLVSVLVALTMLAGVSFAGAETTASYMGGSQNNAATFETLQEARANGPAAVANLESNTGKTYASHPVLDNYPENTTFIYRSANMYGGRAAARMNTNLMVFTEQSFADKDAALAYLKGLGVTDIIDKAIGSVVLVTPSNPAAGFTSADQQYYYDLQTAMFAQKASAKVGDNTTYYSDAEYFGGFGYYYVIGIDGGATFLNNYVANTTDYVGRIAGMLLIGGQMENIRKVATLVPVYLVNATDSVIAKYQAVDQTNASIVEKAKTTYYNQNLPLQKVVTVSDDTPDAAAYIQDAYHSLFVKAMRIPVLKAGLNSASSPYQGYGNDCAPYSLCDRDEMVDGVTADGIQMITKHDDTTFSDIKNDNGSILSDWFEYLPTEVLDGTAPAGSVPLILALHGSGDDPRQFVDEIGLLELAGKERVAVVAPDHQYLGGSLQGTSFVGGILSDVLPRFVEYVLKTYPALDASRVYVTGYSMGGMAVLNAANGGPSLFAAAVPMSAAGYTPTDEQKAQFDKLDMPIMLTTSTYDLPGAFNAAEGILAEGYQAQINLFLGYNEMKPIKTFDFDANPINGFAADLTRQMKLNNEYTNYTWYLKNSDGVPMVALSYTVGLIHALYPEFAKLGWDFAKHYSRNQETGAIVYNPYVD